MSETTHLSKPLRLVQIASGDLWAGAEVQIYNLACALQDIPQLQQSIILMNDNLLASLLRAKGIDVYVVDENQNNTVQIFFSVLSILKKLMPDVVHTQRRKEHIVGGLAAKVCGAKSLRTYHGIDEFNQSWYRFDIKIINVLVRYSGYHWQQGIVAVSHQQSILLAQEYPAEKIYTIENGINIEEIEHRANEVNPDRINENTINIGFVARLVDVKRVDLFIEVANSIKAKNSNIQFHIIGDGPNLEYCQDTVKSEKLSDTVCLHGFKENPLLLLNKMNILLVCSDSEGLPMNVLEAMVLGVPVLSHAVGGIPHTLGYGAYGSLVDEQDINNYADVIIDYAENSLPYIEKAKSAAKHVRENYNIELKAREYVALYLKLLGVLPVCGKK